MPDCVITGESELDDDGDGVLSGDVTGVAEQEKENDALGAIGARTPHAAGVRPGIMYVHRGFSTTSPSTSTLASSWLVSHESTTDAVRTIGNECPSCGPQLYDDGSASDGEMTAHVIRKPPVLILAGSTKSVWIPVGSAIRMQSAVQHDGCSVSQSVQSRLSQEPAPSPGNCVTAEMDERSSQRGVQLCGDRPHMFRYLRRCRVRVRRMQCGVETVLLARVVHIHSATVTTCWTKKRQQDKVVRPVSVEEQYCSHTQGTRLQHSHEAVGIREQRHISTVVTEATEVETIYEARGRVCQCGHSKVGAMCQH